MKTLRFKAILSSLLILLLAAITVTGAMLYIGKAGLILGFRRISVLRFHGRCSLAFLALAACHLASNFHLYAQELKTLFRKGGPRR